MKTRGKIKLTIYLLGFAGAALFTVLLVRQGVMSVGELSGPPVGPLPVSQRFIFYRFFLILLPGASFFRRPFARAGKVCFGCAGSANRSATSFHPRRLAAISCVRALPPSPVSHGGSSGQRDCRHHAWRRYPDLLHAAWACPACRGHRPNQSCRSNFNRGPSRDRCHRRVLHCAAPRHVSLRQRHHRTSR